MKFNEQQKAKLRDAIQKELQRGACSTTDAMRLHMLKDCMEADQFDDDPACYACARKYKII